MTREPLAIRAAVVAAVTAVIHLTVIAGWWAITPAVEGQVALAVDLLGTAVLVVWTRGVVTPTADPRDGQGRPLTPDVDSAPEGYAGRHRPAAASPAVLGHPADDEEGPDGR